MANILYELVEHKCFTYLQLCSPTVNYVGLCQFPGTVAEQIAKWQRQVSRAGLPDSTQPLCSDFLAQDKPPRSQLLLFRQVHKHGFES